MSISFWAEYWVITINGDGECRFWQPAQADSQPKLSGLVLGRQPLDAVLHSSNEPGEFSQWLCHDDSTINIVLDIIIILHNRVFFRANNSLPKKTHCFASWREKESWMCNSSPCLSKLQLANVGTVFGDTVLYCNCNFSVHFVNFPYLLPFVQTFKLSANAVLQLAKQLFWRRKLNIIGYILSDRNVFLLHV